MSTSKENNIDTASEVTDTVNSGNSGSELKRDVENKSPSKVSAYNKESVPQSPQDAIYYQPYFYQSYQNNNSPNSPHNASNGTYDNTFSAQHSGAPFSFTQSFGNNMTPMSPPARDIRNGEANLPPASPLFPGTLPLYSSSSEQLESTVLMNGASIFASNTNPNFQYISAPPPPSPVVSYGFPPPIPSTPEGRSTWADSVQRRQMYNTASSPSPHLHGVSAAAYQNDSRRTTSFDGEMMLPPSAVDNNASNVYATGGTIIHQQPSWAAPPEIYSPQSSLQQQLNQISSPPRIPPLGGMQVRDPNHQNMPSHGGYYPATTPGPPIQTAQNNKGPDGANLFIFHIPNHFTNLDMWHLFCHYGNLLSVRIMVEKDTGRSRGFGFVSYDSPDAAAMAIKELNGYVIGNKRLKVQHKQIRQSESPMQQQDKVSGSQSFQEVSISPNTDNSDWNGETTIDVMQQHSTVVADSSPPPIPDVGNESNDTSGTIGSKLANLNSIREALPDV